MKKNKVRMHQKRKQRRVADTKARRKVHEMTKNLMEHLKSQGVHFPTAPGISDRVTHVSEDVVAIPQCSGVGECCANVIVNLDPADVWRIVNNEKVRQRFGVETTMDLTSKEPGQGIIEYWIDPRVGVSRCKLRYVKPDQGRIECLFLGMDEGKPTCLLGEDRPTICMANPIGRVGQRDDKGHLTGWGYILRDDPCKKCKHKEEGALQVRISDLLIEREMQKRYEHLDLFYGFQGWMAGNVKVEEMRKLATLICFDWDRFLIEFGGHTVEELRNARPESPEHVIASARVIVDGIMKGQQDVISTQGEAETGDDGVEPQGEAVPPDPVG